MRKRMSAGLGWLVCAIAGSLISACGTVTPNVRGEVAVPVETGIALASPEILATPLHATRPILIERPIAGPANSSDETRPEPTASWYPDLWSRLRNGFAMPDLEMPAVREFERFFSQKRYLERHAERARMYLYYVAEEVQKRGMPAEIALLPFVESAFNPRATSPVGACGMFQIMDATGRELGLKNSVFVAQCRDVAESTRAALDYLQILYAQFNDWHLALAAYNWGAGRVARAIERNRAAGKPADFANLRMPDETRAYLPQLQALKNIVRDPQRYGATLPAVENTPYFVEVAIERDIDADLAAKLAGMSLSEFRVLNPSFNRPVITVAGHPRLLLPFEAAVNFLAAMSENAKPLSSWTSHTLSQRESVKSLAARLGVDAEVVRRVNWIPVGMRVKAGSTVVVPRPLGSDGDIPHATVSDAHLAFEPDIPDFRKVKIAVHKGDTPATIAARGAGAAAKENQSRLETLKREIKNLVDAIASCGFSLALKDKLAEAEAERTRLENTAQPAPIAQSVDHVLARYRRLVADLPQNLQKSSERARNALRMLLGDIRLVKEGEAVYAEVEASPERLFMASGGSILGVVAGTGFEPVTFGL